MKSLTKLAALAICAALTPMWAFGAYRTSTSNALTTSNSTITAPSSGSITTESGDLAVVTIQTLQGNAITACSDHYANTWTLQEQYAASVTSLSEYLYVYTVPMTTYGTAETFTCSWTGNEYYSIQVAIFSGRNTSSPLDGSAGTYSDSGYVTSHTGAAVTTSDAGSDVVEFVTDGYSTGISEVYTAGSGFTIGPEETGSGSTDYPAAMVQYDADVSTGSHTGAWTTGSYVEGAAVIIALKESSASCTHEGITSAGALAVPNGSSGSYQGSAGAFVTPNCSSIEYKQPTVGNFGEN